MTRPENRPEDDALRLGASLATVGYGVLALAVPGALPSAGVEALPVAQARVRAAGPRATVTLPAPAPVTGAALYRPDAERPPDEPSALYRPDAERPPDEPSAPGGRPAQPAEPAGREHPPQPAAEEPGEVPEPVREPGRDEREALMRDLRLLDEL